MSEDPARTDFASADRHPIFLAGGGEMGALMRQQDWSNSSLGPPEAWPQSLRTTVSLMLASKFPMFVAWGPDLGLLYNDAYARILGTKHPRALGCRFIDIWSEIWTDILPFIQSALDGKATWAENLPLRMNRQGYDEETYFTFSCSPAQDDAGNVAGLFGVVAETTRQVCTERALRDSEERLRQIVDSAIEYAIVALDQDGRITTWNKGAERLLGYTEGEALGEPGHIFFTTEDRARGDPETEMRLAREDGRAANERWHMRKDGSRFWGSGVMLPVPEGADAAYLKVFRDRTEERAAEERQQLLINELNHRVKNTLATVQAIATQTFRAGKAEPDARESFEERLRALAGAHDVLTQESWEGADLDQIARTALQPFQVSGQERLRIDGPSVFVSPKTALALAMALHELATNAVKYGALSNEAGRVEISWAVKGDDPHLRIHWQESGGPPVSAPDSKSFGSRLIERSLGSDLGAEVRIKFAAEGVVCTIDALGVKLRG